MRTQRVFSLGISVAVAFLTIIWKLGLGTTAEARDKYCLFHCV